MYAYHLKGSLRLLTLFMMTMSTVAISFAQGDDPTQGRPTVGVVYMHTNHLGSTTMTTDESGQVKARFVYEPYGTMFRGACEGPDDVRPKFTGKELDADTELYYFEARYYDAQSGRFTTADIVAGAAVNHPMAFHRYAYSANNPINITDPSGRSLKDDMLPNDDYAQVGKTHGKPPNVSNHNAPAMSQAQDQSSEQQYQIYMPLIAQLEANAEAASSPDSVEEDPVITETVEVAGGTQVADQMMAKYLELVAYLASYGLELEIQFGEGYFQQLWEYAQGQATGDEWVTVINEGVGAYAGFGGGVGIKIAVNPGTQNFLIEFTLEVGLGFGYDGAVLEASVVPIAGEYKLFYKSENGFVDFSYSIFSQATLFREDLVSVKLSHSVIPSLRSYNDKRRKMMPHDWARSGYTYEQYLNVLFWAPIHYTAVNQSGMNCIPQKEWNRIFHDPGYGMSRYYTSPEHAQLFLEWHDFNENMGIFTPNENHPFHSIQ